MLTFNFNPFPIIETPRLILRRLNKDDATAFLRLKNSDEVMQYIDRPRQKTVEEMNVFIDFIDTLIDENKDINWAIVLKENNVLIGTIGFYRTQHEHHRGEVGYMLDSSFWQKGLMHEALQYVLKYGFNQLNFHTIEACINPENIASRALLIKNGFVKEASFKENYFWNGVFKNTDVYTLFNNSHRNEY